MPGFISARIADPKSEQIYEIELAIDQLAALRETLSVEITARRQFRGDKPHEIGAKLSLDFERRVIVVEIAGEEVGQISLNAEGIVEADDADVDGREEFFGSAWRAVRDSILTEGGDPVADAVEDIIEAVPAVDPVLGCLLRGAISAVVPQIIRCYRDIAPQHPGSWFLLGAIGRCLGEHGWRMLGRASWRAFRCMMRGGM
jgi:hypothetical protein